MDGKAGINYSIHSEADTRPVASGPGVFGSRLECNSKPCRLRNQAAPKQGRPPRLLADSGIDQT